MGNVAQLSGTTTGAAVVDGAAPERWPLIHYVATLGFGLRAVVALKGDYIFQVDELMQYLEQGHRLAYGFGHVPWEFRFGSRSWLLGSVIATLLKAMQKLGIDTPNLYVGGVKLVFCALSLSLIYCCYEIGRSTYSERAGRLAATFAAIWYELVFYAHKATPEILATYAFVGAVVCAVAVPRRPILLGALAAATLALRMQAAPAVAVLGVFLLIRWHRRDWVRAVAASIVVLFLAGAFDRMTWGKWFISYYNYFTFQQVYKVADWFGARPFWYFFAVLTLASGGLFWLAPLGLLVRGRPGAWLPLACAAGLIASHSLIPHKEYRFVILAVPLLLTAIAAALDRGLDRFERVDRRLAPVALVSFSIWSALGAAHLFPGQRFVYRMPIYARDPQIEAYRVLREEAELTGIVNLHSETAATGGYYYLHRKVPIYDRDQLKLHGETIDSGLAVSSHVICDRGAALIPDFQTFAVLDDIELRRRIGHAAPNHLAFDGAEILFPRIDGTFVSNIDPTATSVLR